MSTDEDPIEFAEFADPIEGGLSVIIRAGESDMGAGVTPFIASTDDEDRAGDVVRQDWRLRNYRRNPVVLDNHNSGRVVGRAKSVVNRNNDGRSRLEIDVLWDLTNPDPSIQAVGHQHLNGFRSAGSVGFRPGKRTRRDKLPEEHAAHAKPRRVQTLFGEFEVAGEYLEQNELFEFSSASIPMNPSATHRHFMERFGEIASDDIERRAELVEESVPSTVEINWAEMLADAETRATIVGLLWPEFFDRVKADKAVRHVVQAMMLSGPPEKKVHPISAIYAAMEKFNVF